MRIKCQRVTMICMQEIVTYFVKDSPTLALNAVVLIHLDRIPILRKWILYESSSHTVWQPATNNRET